MIRLFFFVQVIFLYSCITYKSINHFAHTKQLQIKKVAGINFFDDKIEIDNGQLKDAKQPVYLVYDKDNLQYVSTENRIANNELIYKLNNNAKDILLTRATMIPAGYTVDTLLFGSSFAIEKTCLFTDDHERVVQFYFKEYKFLNDSLIISSYQYHEDQLPIYLYKKDPKNSIEKMGKPDDIRSYPNADKKSFFKNYIR